MKSKVIFLNVFIFLFLISLVNAETNDDSTFLGTFKQGTCIDIPQTCGSCSYVNITIFYPNLTKAVSNQQMEHQGGVDWNYTFCDTGTIGRYNIQGGGDLEGYSSSFDRYYLYINLSGIDTSINYLIMGISLLAIIALIIFILHVKYRKADYSSSDKGIAEKHNGNWAKTFIKTMGNNLMRNSFLWYYSLGWLFIIVLRELIYTFGTDEVFGFFSLLFNIYSLGFFVILIVWIGVLMDHFKIITETINDISWGVGS